MRIAVLGAGSWGTTLAVLLSNKSHEVTLWSYGTADAERIRFSRENTPYLPGILIPPAISVTSDLSEAVVGAEMVVAAVPSQFVRSVMAAVPPGSLDNCIIVNVAKGIEVERS
jgi:glycerol-3-phosphate dehydrogenase (NAD(P)+)